MKFVNKILIIGLIIFFYGCGDTNTDTPLIEDILNCDDGTTTITQGDTLENPDGAVIKIVLSSSDSKNICIKSGSGAYIVRGE